MKTIGLIGGMSWESTVTYYQLINEAVKKSLGGLHSAKILLYSVDFQEIEECQTRGDWEKSARILGDAAKGLEGAGVKVNEPFFVRFGRVATMDQIGDGLPAEVVCVLLGERPGLVTAESMSAYIAYKPTVGMAESRRTVLANIHRGGTPAVEAGAHIVDLIRLMLEKKRSGIDLPV